MPRKPPAATFVHAVGGDLRCEVERSQDPETIDHVWITMRAGATGPLVISVNTRSLHNERAGFDSRVRRGILRGTWTTLPSQGVVPCSGFDYAPLEQQANIYYEPCERSDLENFLNETCAHATLLEAWGVPYSVPVTGLHQIHSRRASCAISRDIQGLDGALQFYFADQSTLLIFFKFCGQP